MKPMDVMQIRSVPGSSLQLLGDVTDLDSRSHEVKVEFPHERVDSYRTTFGPDCFRESFAQQMPVMCWAHDLRDPIGRGIRAQVLPTHNEVVGRFSDLEAVPSSKRAFTQIDDGTITDFSFGYINGLERPHPDPQLRRRGVRQIPKASMREFSPVSIGSIPGAKVSGIREDGNLVTVDSPESVIRMVELNIISPEQGNELLRSFGVLDGVRAGFSARNVDTPGSHPGVGSPYEAGGGTWTVADAVSHLSEVHGMGQYQAGLARMTPQTLAILHEQVGNGFHDHGPFTGWLAAIRADIAQAIAAGGSSLFSPVDQAAAAAFAAAAGYTTHPGVGTNGTGDWGPSVPAIKQQVVGAAGYNVTSSGSGYPVAGGMGGGRSEGGLATPEDGWDESMPVRADDVIRVIERAHPQMAMKLREGKIAVAPLEMEILFRSEDGSVIDGGGQPLADGFGSGVAPEVSDLALNVDAALDNAAQWLDGIDMSELPEEARQAFALVSAAADGSGALIDVLGVAGQRDSDGDDISDTPWEQFDESDYTPEQWRSACLIDTGSGGEDSKDRYALPVKEPGGKLNRHGVTAAASRISQVKGAPDDEVKKAARSLMGYYGRMKKPTPPNVLKVLGKGERADAAELEQAERRLAERLAVLAKK